MSIAVQIPPVNTPLTNKQGRLDDLWSRWFVRATTAVSLDCAPADAQYWTATANDQLTNERNLGALSSGYVKAGVSGGVAVPTTTATIPSSDLVGALPALDGSALTSLTSGHLVGALPAISGAALTSLTSGNLVGALPAISGSALTALNAAVLSGVLPALNAAALTALTGTNVVHQVVTKVFADSPYTVLSSDETIVVDATGGAVTITLPTPTSGRVLCVKKVDASANAVTLSGTVDGVVNPTLPAQYDARILQGDGSVWWIVGRA